MDLIQRRQAAVMNQHYQRYSLDYFLDAQQRIGFTSIELWCGAQHFGWTTSTMMMYNRSCAKCSAVGWRWSPSHAPAFASSISTRHFPQR